MAKIIELQSNIFDSQCQTLVNSVNCVGVMGKGIALEFKIRFPDMYRSYVMACEQKALKPGTLQLYTKSSPWILNFPTKYHWKFPSKLEYIELGLKKFAETYTQKGITSVAFPKLGTSLGGLVWEDVRTAMYDYLKPLPSLDVEIYHFGSGVKDKLFDQLREKLLPLELRDYMEAVGLKSRQATLLMKVIQNQEAHSMLELQKLEGFGEKSIQKLYDFVMRSKQGTITDIEPQLTLV